MIINNVTVLGVVPVKQFLYDELAEIVLPSSSLLLANKDETEMPSDPRFQIANHMDTFVKRFAQVRYCKQFFDCVFPSRANLWIAICGHIPKCMPQSLSHPPNSMSYDCRLG
jgi:hypothetical protein